MTWWDILLFVLIFVISFFSVIAGGVGLLTRPVLILFGYPPEIAIGSFRVANLFSRLAGFIPLVQGKAIDMDWRLASFLFIPSLIGGIIGAEIVNAFNPPQLKIVLGIFVLLLGFVFFIKKDFGFVQIQHRPTVWKKWVGFIGTMLIGIFASFVGGSGILFAYLLILNYDKSYLSSAAIRKVANFGSALSASLIFLWYGIVDWYLMLLVLFADGIGEYLGGKYQLKKGIGWIRTITIFVVIACGIALIFF
jgi:uncharacterized protein